MVLVILILEHERYCAFAPWRRPRLRPRNRGKCRQEEERGNGDEDVTKFCATHRQPQTLYFRTASSMSAAYRTTLARAGTVMAISFGFEGTEPTYSPNATRSEGSAMT